jgi:hypothetical protein
MFFGFAEIRRESKAERLTAKDVGFRVLKKVACLRDED